MPHNERGRYIDPDTRMTISEQERVARRMDQGVGRELALEQTIGPVRTREIMAAEAARKIAESAADNTEVEDRAAEAREQVWLGRRGQAEDITEKASRGEGPETFKDGSGYSEEEAAIRTAQTKLLEEAKESGDVYGFLGGAGKERAEALGIPTEPPEDV